MDTKENWFLFSASLCTSVQALICMVDLWQNGAQIHRNTVALVTMPACYAEWGLCNGRTSVLYSVGTTASCTFYLELSTCTH